MSHFSRLSAAILIFCLITQPAVAQEVQDPAGGVPPSGVVETPLTGEPEPPVTTDPEPAPETPPAPAPEPVVEPIEKPITEPVTEPMVEPIVEPVAEEAVEISETPTVPAAPAAITGEYIEGEVLVKFKDGSLNLEKRSGEALAEEVIADVIVPASIAPADATDAADEADAANTAAAVNAADPVEAGVSLEIEEIIPEANIAIVDTGTLDTAEAIAAIEASPEVEYAEPNYLYRIEDINTDDTYREDLWALENIGQAIGNGVSTITGTTDDDIDAPESWELSRGAGVIVAVIDTGVDYTHPDLANNMWDGESCVDEDGATLGGCTHGYDFYIFRDDRDPAPGGTGSPYNHGTHVAGTIAAAINNAEGTIGVAPEARIMALRADFQVDDGEGGEDTVLSTDAVVRAINFARHNGAKVINASFGGGGSSISMQEAIADFGDAGGIFIAAAGNTTGGGIDTDVTPFYPASYDLPNIIAVAASNQNDALASFSNYGEINVDISAPGVNILSTVTGGGYEYKNGTSMAAPHVAGVTAQLFAYDPTLTVSEIRAAILEGDAIAGQSGSTATGMRLNAFGALNSLSLATSSALTVEVVVVNDHNGTATTSDFAFSINGGTAQSVATTTSTTTLTSTIFPGRYYTVAGANASGYDYSASNCTDLVAAAGATVTCTLTYNDTAPVVSGGGGGGGGGGSSKKKTKKVKEKKEEKPKPTKVITKTPELVPAATSPAPRFLLDRSIGAQGSDVTELQRTLAAKGYLAAAPTGYFGPLTADALRRYQAANLLPATGILDAATRAKLNAEASAVPSNVLGAQTDAALQAQIASLKQQLAALVALLAARKAQQ